MSKKNKKRSKQEKVKALIEYLEPLSDITAIDLDVRKTDSIALISGRYQSATNKRLVMIPYYSHKDCGVYIELSDPDLDYVAVKTVKQFSAISIVSQGGKDWITKEMYDKTIHFEDSEMKILGRFLRVLSTEFSDRNLKISVDPRSLGERSASRPETFISAFINAASIIGNRLRKSTKEGVRRITGRKKKEFFFKEKLGEVDNANES